MYKKRIAAALLAALLSLGWVLSASASSVTANNGKISLTLPDKYTTVENTASSIADHADFISTLGHSTDSFTSYLKEAGILLFAATADNTSQVQIKSWSTDFSEKLGNLALFSDDEDSLNQAAESLVTESTGETVIGISRVAKSDGTLSLRIEKLVSAERDFSYLQYVTILDGRYYALVYYNFGGAFTEIQRNEAESLFASLSIAQKNTVSISGNHALGTVLLWVAIGVLAVFSIILMISLIRDFRLRRIERVKSGDRIQRRKF
ncbi:MAG: hypothetical protein ACOYKJ_01555 [Candidatus Howiella sp.]